MLACWVLLILYWNISARSSKPVAESQSWSGRLAGLHSAGCGMGASVWPAGDTQYRYRGVFRGCDLCSRPVCGHLVTKNPRERLEQRCRVETGAQACGTGPVSIRASSNLHEPSAHGAGNGRCVGFAGSLRGTLAFLHWLLDQAEAGGKSPAESLSERVSRLQGSG